MQLRGLAFLAVGFGLFAACGGKGTGFNGDAGPEAGLDAGGYDVSLTFPDASGDSPNACPNQCSNDFHDVIDCNGNLVSQCMGTDGCDTATGTCTNACQAAIDNKNSIGCEYYATFMEQYDGASACFVAFVANTWDTPVTINVDFNGMSYGNVSSFTRIPSGKGQGITYNPYSGTLPAGQVAILFLGGSQGAGPAARSPLRRERRACWTARASATRST